MIKLILLYWEASQPYYGEAWGEIYLDMTTHRTFVA
jgi:hypothetical protein